MASLLDPTSSVYGASISRTDNEGPFNAAIVDAVAQGKILAIPPVATATPWKISDKLTIASGSHGLTILGGSRVFSRIEQQTDNTPVIEMSGQTHSLTFEGLDLGWANQQTTSHTDSYGFKITNSASGSQVVYGSTIRNCRVSSPYRGIGITGTGTIVPWGWTIDHLWIQDYAQDGVYWVSPVAGGMPNNVATNVYIIGRNGEAAGYAWRSGAAEWRIVGMDIEQIASRAIYISGGRPVSIQGLHLENISVTAAGILVEIANDPLWVQDVRLANLTIDAVGATYDIFKLDAGGSLMLDNFEPGTLTITNGTLAFLNSASGNAAYVRGYTTSASITPFDGATTKIRQFEVHGASVQTFTDGDTSPSVLGYTRFSTANSSGTTITTFDNGFAGQEITIIFTDANTTIAETDNIKLSGSFTSTADDTMRLVYNGTSWFELSRSVN